MGEDGSDIQRQNAGILRSDQNDNGLGSRERSADLDCGMPRRIAGARNSGGDSGE